MTKSKSQVVTLTCRHCKRRYNARWDPSKPEKNSRCCGRSPCFELENWTEEDWAAKRELALKMDQLPPERIQYQWDDRGISVVVDGMSDHVGAIGRAAIVR